MNSSLWTLFHEKMSREEDHKTLQEECKDAKEAFLRRRKIDRERRVRESAAERQERLKADRKRVFAKLTQESREEREKRLKIIRDNKASRRALEITEQREKRLRTDRKQAALKRASETGQERERRLRAMRELAAKKRATESSQEKELRLRARRERAAVKRHSENRSETVETGRRNETRQAADNRRRNERAALFEAHRVEYLHNRGWANPENRGLHHEEWAQEEMAAFHRLEENLRHYHCVICKEAWPLSASRQQMFTCSRCKRDRKPCRLYSAENDMDPGSVPAELQGLSEVEELLIARAFPMMSIYRKHGGQRGYKGHVLNLPQDIQGFLNSLPANMSDLPILVMRKQGAGESLK